MKKLIVLFIAVATIAAAHAQSRVVAHRGFWDAEGSAQNSIRSLVKADSIGCWGSEFDVWMTADGTLVVNHDATINGIVIESAKTKPVAQCMLSNGEYVPFLESYLQETVLHPNIQLVCELKSHTNKEQEAKAVKKIIKMMKRYGLQDRVTYIAFSPDATLNFVKYAPKGTEVYYLNGDWTPQQLKDAGCAGADYHLGVMKAHPEWIEQCHQMGLKVNIWTVNKPEDLQWCIDAGADFITTNAPLLLQQMLKK
ncbi:MAG: glycerophosphodiester phosphodiesterase family protein [Muribaculaceae bacterium]